MPFLALSAQERIPIELYPVPGPAELGPATRPGWRGAKRPFVLERPLGLVPPTRGRLPVHFRTIRTSARQCLTEPAFAEKMCLCYNT